MLRLSVLNCIAPKLRPPQEGLDAHTRNWYSDGYRTSVPGTSTCRQDSDCEGSEICQAGYCAGIHRKYSTHGLYYGNEYKDLIAHRSPLAYLEYGDYRRPHDFFYRDVFNDTGKFNVNQPIDVPHRRITDVIDYDYTY